MSPIRIVGAPLLLAALAGILYLDYRLEKPLGVTVLVGFFAVASYRELCQMSKLKGAHPETTRGMVFLAVLFALAFRGFLRGESDALSVGLPVVSLVFLLLVLAQMVLRFGRFTPLDAGVTLLWFAYVSLMAWILLPQKGGPANLWFLAFLVATNKGSDMAAYTAGKLFGRHKMAPQVSPNKTWEGAAAGLLVGGGAGALVLHFWRVGQLPTPAILTLILVAAAVTVVAQVGDLVKSAVKRWAGVKDSGRILPEFGGALDMCDSFILSAPVAWFLLKLV